MSDSTSEIKIGQCWKRLRSRFAEPFVVMRREYWWLQRPSRHFGEVCSSDYLRSAFQLLSSTIEPHHKAALYHALRNMSSPFETFAVLAMFYDAAEAVYSERKDTEQAELCRVARDGAEMVRALLSETGAANETRTNELLQQLRASIDATRLRIPHQGLQP